MVPNDESIHSSIKGKLYDKQHNPEGTINLATAENSLMSTELIDVCDVNLLPTL